MSEPRQRRKQRAIPTRALVFLARDDVGFVRAAAIVNPRTAAIVLIHAQNDPDDQVRAAAAGHHRLDRRVCCRFAADRSERVRLALAANPAAGPCCARALMQSPSPEVRRKLASNPATSAAVLDTLLMHDPDHRVRLHAFCGLLRVRVAKLSPRTSDPIARPAARHRSVWIYAPMTAPSSRSGY